MHHINPCSVKLCCLTLPVPFSLAFSLVWYLIFHPFAVQILLSKSVWCRDWNSTVELAATQSSCVALPHATTGSGAGKGLLNQALGLFGKWKGLEIKNLKEKLMHSCQILMHVHTKQVRKILLLCLLSPGYGAFSGGIFKSSSIFRAASVKKSVFPGRAAVATAGGSLRPPHVQPPSVGSHCSISGWATCGKQEQAQTCINLFSYVSARMNESALNKAKSDFFWSCW